MEESRFANPELLAQPMLPGRSPEECDLGPSGLRQTIERGGILCVSDVAKIGHVEPTITTYTRVVLWRSLS